MQKIKTVRFGLIGCGNIITGILPEVLKGRNYEVIAAAASDPARARAFARRFHLEAETSYASLLKRPDIDAVYISLPEFLHAPWSMAAARAGKHVLCEKTLAPSLTEVKQMLETAKRNKVRLLEAFMWRFSDGAAALKRETSRLGAPRSFHARFGFNFDDKKNYRNFKKLGGGALNDLGCYCLSASRLVMGGEPLKVSASLTGGSKSLADRHGLAWLEFKGGALASIEFSFSSHYNEGFNFVGTKGTLDFKFPVIRGDQHLMETVKAGRRRILRPKQDPRYRLMFEAFSKELRRQPSRPGAFEKEALAQARAMQALRRSAHTDTVVGV